MKNVKGLGARGYTLVEVMTSIAVLTVGATGVVGLQRATLVANNNGRMLATANMIATTWAERLQTDATQWNNPGSLPDLTDTTWVQGAQTNPGVWFIPAISGTMSAVADPMGADISGADVSAKAFCTHLRFFNMYPNALVRAEIRVFWDRSGQPVDCATVPAVWDSGKYGAVYMATALVQNVTQQ
jgi:type IV pilus assembly protein PilV